MRNGRFETRTAVAGDAVALAELHIAVWREAYAGIMPDALLAGLDAAARYDSWRERIASPAERTQNFVLTYNDIPAGFGICGPSRLAELGADGEIFAINILAGPARKCRGGAALMAEMAAELGRNVFATVGLWTLDRNRRGIAFYRQLGGADGARRAESFGDTELIDRAFLWPTPGELHARALTLAAEAGWA